MSLFLGIDGGGTSTSCLLGDERSVLGEAKAGPSNILRVGEATSQQSITSAIRQACATAGVDPFQIKRTCIGVAGAARPDIAAKILSIVKGVVSGDVEVAGDMVIALHAAFGSGPGVCVIAGTGSIAYGRDANGQTARAGGWGSAISDEGSGYWIGRSAVICVMRANDDGGASNHQMVHGIMKAWDLKNFEELVLSANSPANFAALFPAVAAAADAGDETAARVLRRAGVELAMLAQIIINRLFVSSPKVPVAVAGGVFENSSLVRDAFYDEVRRNNMRVLIADKISRPVTGALDRARQPGSPVTSTNVST